jgi:hypothetical protein
MQLPKCTSAQKLKAQLKKHGAGIDHVAAAAALSHLAKLGERSDDAAAVAAPLVSALLKSVEACSARQLANSLWALGQLQLQELPQAQQLLAAIVAQLLAGDAERLRSSNLIEAANIAVGLAKLQRQELPLLDALADHVPGLLQPAAAGAAAGATPAAGPQLRPPGGGSTHELSGLLWGAATLRYYSPALCSALASALAQQLHSCSSRALSTSLWALATLGHPCDQLFEAAARLLLSDEVRQQCSARDLASNAWALATAAALQAADEGAAAADVAAAASAASSSAALLEPLAEAASALVLAAAQAPLASVPATARQQLLQSLLTFELLGRPLLGTGLLAGTAAAGAAGGPPEQRALLESCREAWLRQARRPLQSALHKEVLQVGGGPPHSSLPAAHAAGAAGAAGRHDARAPGGTAPRAEACRCAAGAGGAGLPGRVRGARGRRPAVGGCAAQGAGRGGHCTQHRPGGARPEACMRRPAGRPATSPHPARRAALPVQSAAHCSLLLPRPPAGRRWTAPLTSAATWWAAPGAAWVPRAPGSGCWRGWAWRLCSWRTGAGTSWRGRRRARRCCLGCCRRVAEGG